MRESFRGDGMCPYCATTHRFERLAYEVFQQPVRALSWARAGRLMRESPREGDWWEVALSCPD